MYNYSYYQCVIHLWFCTVFGNNNNNYSSSQSTPTLKEQVAGGVTGNKSYPQANGGPIRQENGSCAAHAKANLTSITESDFDFDHVYDYIDNDDANDDDNVYI